eukprot:69490-Pyramimonas_sp.AAC.1
MLKCRTQHLICRSNSAARQHTLKPSLLVASQVPNCRIGTGSWMFTFSCYASLERGLCPRAASCAADCADR